MHFVAIKMGRRQGGPSRTGGEERNISKSIRDRRATRPPAHFHRNPPGRGRLAVFLRCSLDPYESDRGARSRLEKQPTDLRQNACYFGDRTLAWKSREPKRSRDFQARSASLQFAPRSFRLCVW